MEKLLRQSLPFFEVLPPEERQLLLSSAMSMTYPGGHILAQGDAECTGVEIIGSGRARVFANSPGGGEITLFRLLPGDVCLFSAACMLRGLTVETSMQTEEETELVVIPTGVYRTLSERVPAVQAYTLQLMAEKLSDVMWMLQQFVFSNVARRLADALLERRNLDGSDELHLTHEVLARDLGTAREVVTRLLKQMQLDGLVELSRGKIRLLDLKKLIAL